MHVELKSLELEFSVQVKLRTDIGRIVFRVNPKMRLPSDQRSVFIITIKFSVQVINIR